MKIIITCFMICFSFWLQGQDQFFHWKQSQNDRIAFLKDSLSKAFPTPLVESKYSFNSEFWVQERLKSKTIERDLTIRFLVLSGCFSDFFQDSIATLELKKKQMQEDSFPERYKVTIQGIEKLQTGLKELSKQWWPILIERELALIEWEIHEEISQKSDVSLLERDSIWKVNMIRNNQEALFLKNQLLPWHGVEVRSKQVFSLKTSESPSIMEKNWNYFWGCDSLAAPFSAEHWKMFCANNQYKTIEKERNKEEFYFNNLQKNRENWEFLDQRENTLERMRAFVTQYDRIYLQEDSIRNVAIMRARSPQELIDLKRERERWKMAYYKKGVAQLAEIGNGIEGGPTVQDYSKQKGFFKLKDVQNVKKQNFALSSVELNQEEKETINPVNAFHTLQILHWNGVPNSFKTLK
jgi:hypothetical protein